MRRLEALALALALCAPTVPSVALGQSKGETKNEERTLAIAVGESKTLPATDVESLVTVGTGADDRSVNIRLEFFFVQYHKSRSCNFGLSWPSQIGGQGVLDTSAVFDMISMTFTPAQTAVVRSPLPFLDIAASKGWTKVLKQSAVITVNGNEAQFTNGGEHNSGRQTTKLSTVVFLRLEEDVEGAVFIIPSGVETAPKSSYNMGKEAMAPYDDYSGNLGDIKAFPKAPPASGSEKSGPKN